MADKAKDERVESALPPDEADYRERSSRERTSALPPGKAGQKDAMSPRKEDYHQREADR